MFQGPLPSAGGAPVGMRQHPRTGQWWDVPSGTEWGSHGPMTPVPDSVQQQMNYAGRQQAQQQSRWEQLAGIAQSSAAPELAGLGASDAMLRQMMGLSGVERDRELDWINQQRGFASQAAGLQNRGLGITLADIRRRRGFAGRDLGISEEDIEARRGFAGTDRDLSRQLIETDRERLTGQRDMDRALLDSEYIPRGAFGSNMAKYRRGFLDEQLGLNLADRDTQWDQTDLGFAQAMRGLLTEEQRAKLGYDSTMSGLLTQEQRARLDRASGGLSSRREMSELDLRADQIRHGAFRDQLQHHLDMASNDQQRQQILSGIATSLASQNVPQDMIDEILGDFIPTPERRRVQVPGGPTIGTPTMSPRRVSRPGGG